MNKENPVEPKFVRTITSLQKVLASIVGTMIIVIIITAFDFVKDIFKPDYLKALVLFRVVVSLAALSITCIVGYQQIGKIMTYIIEVYEFYKTISEAKKKEK